MSMLINVLIGVAASILTVFVGIWFFNRFIGDVTAIGKGQLTQSTGATKLFPVASTGSEG